ncbi:MAG: hypothetical protein WBB29_22170 [Geitlerinemataceae cyanobacterium]
MSSLVTPGKIEISIEFHIEIANISRAREKIGRESIDLYPVKIDRSIEQWANVIMLLANG